jgi:hypothetical protein
MIARRKAFMINVWHVLMLLAFNSITLFAAFYSGFYFGYKNKTGEAPKDTPLHKVWDEFGGVVETVTAPLKKKEPPEDEDNNAFYE